MSGIKIGITGGVLRRQKKNMGINKKSPVLPVKTDIFGNFFFAFPKTMLPNPRKIPEHPADQTA